MCFLNFPASSLVGYDYQKSGLLRKLFMLFVNVVYNSATAAALILKSIFSCNIYLFLVYFINISTISHILCLYHYADFYVLWGPFSKILMNLSDFIKMSFDLFISLVFDINVSSFVNLTFCSFYLVSLNNLCCKGKYTVCSFFFIIFTHPSAQAGYDTRSIF